jgi:hypothetical protein
LFAAKGTWDAKIAQKTNEAVQKLGFLGNIGSRQKFTFDGQNYYLLEAQDCFNCWDTWRIILCDKNLLPITVLPIQTPHGSKSFANPNIR